MFFNLGQFLRDIVEITDSGRGPTTTKALVSLSVLRNFDPKKPHRDLVSANFAVFSTTVFTVLPVAAINGPRRRIPTTVAGDS
jgi:hypothetical protein